MYKEILKGYKYDQLILNKSKFEQMIEDLHISLIAAIESNDELKATNAMLKTTIDFLKKEMNPTPEASLITIERSSERSLSTHSTEINETLLDDIEEPSVSPIKVFSSSPNKVLCIDSNVTQGQKTQVLFRKSKRAFSKSHVESESVSQEPKPNKVSVTIFEDVDLPNHHYKTMSMKNSLSSSFVINRNTKLIRKS